MKVLFTQLCANPVAIRTVNTEDISFANLMSSIEQRGLLQPLLVRPYSVEGFEGYCLIDGMHRFVAITKLRELGNPNFDEIEVLVREGADTETEAKLLALTSNIQRQQMRTADVKKTILDITKVDPTLSTKRLAAMLCKPVEFVAKVLGILEIANEEIQALVDGEVISVNKAYWLSKLSPEDQVAFLESAKVQSADEFIAAVKEHLKLKNDALRQGKDGRVVEFQPVEKIRRLDAIKYQRDVNYADVLNAVSEAGVTDVPTAVRVAFDWLLQVDAKSVAEQKANFEAQQAARAEAKAKRDAEKATRDAEKSAANVDKLAADPEARKKLAEQLAAAEAKATANA